jgi:hypothetical protein
MYLLEDFLISRTRSEMQQVGLMPIKIWMWSETPLMVINFWPCFCIVPVMNLYSSVSHSG